MDARSLFKGTCGIPKKWQKVLDDVSMKAEQLREHTGKNRDMLTQCELKASGDLEALDLATTTDKMAELRRVEGILREKEKSVLNVQNLIMKRDEALKRLKKTNEQEIERLEEEMKMKDEEIAVLRDLTEKKDASTST